MSEEEYLAGGLRPPRWAVVSLRSALTDVPTTNEICQANEDFLRAFASQATPQEFVK